MQELRVSRITTVVLGIVAIVLGIPFEKQNIAFMVGLAFAVAASGNFPVLFLSMYWKRLTTRGAVVGGFLGLITAVGLVILLTRRCGSLVLGSSRPRSLPVQGARPVLDGGRLRRHLAVLAARTTAGPRSRRRRRSRRSISARRPGSGRGRREPLTSATPPVRARGVSPGTGDGSWRDRMAIV